jgi:hypothetical protein
MKMPSTRWLVATICLSDLRAQTAALARRAVVLINQWARGLQAEYTPRQMPAPKRSEWHKPLPGEAVPLFRNPNMPTSSVAKGPAGRVLCGASRRLTLRVPNLHRRQCNHVIFSDTDLNISVPIRTALKSFLLMIQFARTI